MKPLIVLLVAFAATLLVIKLMSGQWNYILAGNIAMSIMLLFTAMGHFAFTEGMTMMIPPFIPYKKALVYVTGIIEITTAAGLLLPSTQALTAGLLILFFVMLLPANIYAAMKGVDYQKGTYEAPNLTYLWFRVPLQLLFIAWVGYFGLYNQ
ncbi:DoxX family protein [Fibrella forsythiae]|uniref:DoxX family membrane protein n=1 Tax=Fibrella forsythiae TaxID=2817061 RepID=A0ABS3JHK2_9BACT|nr:hypothetical protein [Fibrella forsythiae]MBO0949445.1 hypothetical protein [Fibrella forsythiae]